MVAKINQRQVITVLLMKAYLIKKTKPVNRCC